MKLKRQESSNPLYVLSQDEDILLMSNSDKEVIFTKTLLGTIHKGNICGPTNSVKYNGSGIVVLSSWLTLINTKTWLVVKYRS